jgi:hypothetical protein
VLTWNRPPIDVRNVVGGFGERISLDELTTGRRADHFARHLSSVGQSLIFAVASDTDQTSSLLQVPRVYEASALIRRR